MGLFLPSGLPIRNTADFKNPVKLHRLHRWSAGRSASGFFPVPGRRLLIGVGKFQQRFLAERLAEQLQADGQLRVLREAARDA